MYKCLLCNKSFKSRRSLANHLRRENISSKEYKRLFESELYLNKIEGIDYVSCPLCGKKLSRLFHHLKYTHKLSDNEISNLNCKLVCDNDKLITHISNKYDSYGKVVYRSSYEYKVSEYLLQLNYNFKYEPFWIKYYHPIKMMYKYYNPDFYIDSLNLVLEVKPSKFLSDEVILAKSNSVIDKGYKFKFVTERDIIDINTFNKLILMI